MPRPKYFLFMTSVNKFQLHLFFKLFSPVAEVEELIHQSEGPWFHRLHVNMPLDMMVKHPLLVCRCLRAMLMSLISPTGLWGETKEVSSNYSCWNSVNGKLFCQILMCQFEQDTSRSKRSAAEILSTK